MKQVNPITDFADEKALGSHLLLYAQARYGVACATLTGAFVAVHGLGITDLSLKGFALLAVTMICYNFVLSTLIQNKCHKPNVTKRFLHGAIHASISSDFLCLTWAVYLVGGVASPFFAFYCFHVLIASFLLNKLVTYCHVFFGFLLYVGMVLLEHFNILPHHQPVGLVISSQYGDDRFLLTMIVVQALLLGLTAVLATGLAELLREGERKLHVVNEELATLSQQRKDFMDIAFHDVKAPVGAVLTLLDNMGQGLGGPTTERQLRWIDRCQVRLRSLLEFFNDLHILTNLKSSNLEQPSTTVIMAKVVIIVKEDLSELVKQRQQSLEISSCPETETQVKGIDRLLCQAVINLVTNAIKYTPVQGHIQIKVSSTQDTVFVEVIDTGIGISAEDLPKLFSEYTRVNQEQSKKLGAAGFGLGLSVVKRIVERHGGKIKVESTPGAGSHFTIALPKAI